MTAPRKRKLPPFKLTMPEPDETSRLYAILEYLNYDRRVAWAHRMNTGGAKFARGDGTAQFVKFGFAGLSDIIGQLRDGRFLAIECKSRTGRAKEEQKAFLLFVQKHQGVAGIARTIEDAHAILAGRVYDPEIYK